VTTVNCNDVLEQLSDFLDEDQRADLCRKIEEHLSQCHGCRFQVDTVKKTITLYQADRQADRTIELPVTVSRSLQAKLDREYQMVETQRASGSSGSD
jgi:predicted anti-sigma-YlaC factor YlaD